MNSTAFVRGAGLVVDTQQVYVYCKFVYSKDPPQPSIVYSMSVYQVDLKNNRLGIIYYADYDANDKIVCDARDDSELKPVIPNSIDEIVYNWAKTAKENHTVKQ